MRRDLALECLKNHVRDDDIVVPVFQTCFDWLAINPRDLAYVALGAMGQASSHGLGLALTCPDRRVFVFDGDGSLLMNLGALVSVAESAPSNFFHFVFNNGVYEVNGVHPLPAQDKVDFETLARGAGYRAAVTFSDLGDFEANIAAFLDQEGPVLAVLKIEPGVAYPRDYVYIHSAAARARFRQALIATS